MHLPSPRPCTFGHDCWIVRLKDRRICRKSSLKYPIASHPRQRLSRCRRRHVACVFHCFCLLYYQFAECHVAFLQHGRMDHLLWRHARSRSWINLANKALEAARRTQASSSCLRCWNRVPFLGIQTTFWQEATYPRYMLILFDAVMEKGQLHAIYGIPTRHGASCEGYIEKLPREGECTNPEAEGGTMWPSILMYFVFQAPHKAETTWNNAVSFVFQVAELPSAPLRSFSSEAPGQDWEYYEFNECILMHLI